MNRKEERRDLSKKILVGMLSYDDGEPALPNLPTFQKNLAKIVVDYAEALLDELDKRESATTEEKAGSFDWHVSLPIATGEVQVGDLVMVRRTFEKWNLDKRCYELHIGPWLPEIVLPLAIVGERTGHYRHVPGTVSLEARHLTDEERAKIKRI